MGPGILDVGADPTYKRIVKQFADNASGPQIAAHPCRPADKISEDGNSIRLGFLRSEVSTFVGTGRIELTIHFTSSDDAFLTYGLEHEADLANVVVRHRQSEVTIVLPRQQAISWAETGQIGIYSAVHLGRHGILDVIVEKDFACLDLGDADNHDTFPNPPTWGCLLTLRGSTMP